MAKRIASWNRKRKTVARVRGTLFLSKRKLIATFPDSVDSSTVCVPMADLENAKLYVSDKQATHDLVLDTIGTGKRRDAKSQDSELSPQSATRVMATFSDKQHALAALDEIAKSISPDPLRWVKRVAVLGLLYLVLTTPWKGLDSVIEHKDHAGQSLPSTVAPAMSLPSPRVRGSAPAGDTATDGRDPFGLNFKPD